jgi:hypothetical protein
MKTKKLTYLMLLLAIIMLKSTLKAQTIPVPDFTGKLYYLVQDSVLKSTEVADAQVEVKLKKMGYAGSDVGFKVFTPKSEVRFLNTSLPRLIVRVDGNVDPMELYSLSKAKPDNNARFFLQTSRNVTGQTLDVSSNFVKIEFKKVRDGVFEVVFPPNLQPGEYGFVKIDMGNLIAANKVKIYCFGID